MFLSRKTFEDLLTERAVAVGEAAALREQNKVHQVTQDWMRFRIAQLEKERAQLFYNISGVKIPVPEIENKQPELAVGANHPFNKLPSFEDMGDEEAGKMGIRTMSDGTIRYQ